MLQTAVLEAVALWTAVSTVWILDTWFGGWLLSNENTPLVASVSAAENIITGIGCQMYFLYGVFVNGASAGAEICLCY